jgi:hypothetical protein
VVGHAGSGLSVFKYCEREGVSPNSFYSWRSRLAATTAKSDKHHCIDEQMNFLPVEIERQMPLSDSTKMLSIAFPSGLIIEAPGTPILLREICRSMLCAHGLL